ncbi:MAG TPA: T9SS type A sorting domain-containing protein, partial [Candidatus Kapabacteria bacterium]|nr:T9SS type A sorting domain-containing protein [Candidatus Kapabacteria bacterium]
LADYLYNGGNLYMEGGDTWAFDAQRAVHPMFKISGLSDGQSDLSTIAGQNNAFTYDMSFTYSGNNSYADRLAAISPAFVIFKNSSPSYTCAVAYNSGTYKTIGSSFQFGGLNNGTSPSTRIELLSEYLQFFEVIPKNSLTIELPNSWKMISSNVLPKNQSIENIMSEVDDNLRIMKNSYGKIYIPTYNINTIVNWDIKHGYNLYMTEESTLIIEGRDVNPLTTPIEFLPGWHMFSYLRNSPMSVQTALAPVTNDFLIVKSETGMYVPSYGINTLGNMQPGKGYYIYVLNNTTLTYPANSSYKAVEGQEYFNDKHINLGTGNTMSLILKAEDIKEGTEIFAKDNENNVYGNGFVRNGKAALLIWGDDEFSDGKNGFNSNEAINLFAKNEFLNINSTNDLIEQTGADYISYKTDGLAYAEIIEKQSNSDNLLCFPQPAKETVNISFNLEIETNVSLDILSTNGSLIKRINLGNISAGKHTHSINLNEFSTGVYSILLNAGGFIKSEKITVIK